MRAATFTVLPSTVMGVSRANSLTVFGSVVDSVGAARDTPIVRIATRRLVFHVLLDFMTDQGGNVAPLLEHVVVLTGSLHIEAILEIGRRAFNTDRQIPEQSVYLCLSAELFA